MHSRILSSQLPERAGTPIILRGWVHRIRNLGGVRFLLLRDRSGIAQVVLPSSLELGTIGCESVVQIDGKARREPRAPQGVEVLADHVRLVAPAEAPPIEVFKPLGAQRMQLQTLLDNRPIALRMPEVLEIFHVQAAMLRGFRSHLNVHGFTEITTPKLVLAGAEGGSALFEVEYYDRKAYLAQSPQFYKQMMVGSGLERVFEVGHAYRAEKSETSRHLAEFVSLDFEMGFIEGIEDLMQMLSSTLAAVFDEVRESCGEILRRRKLQLPTMSSIPSLDFPDAQRVLREEFGREVEGDLDTESERLIGQWALRELNSPLIFVTGYALHCRPVYTMPHERDESRSASFDLLHHGLEISTGGQRLHRHDALVDAMRARGLEPAHYSDYLSTFRHGMPPHGGMGLGLERLTKQALGLANVKEACLFPRDRNRLRP
jgi:nondiscriminating aspartyl-tRNA synthetase